MPPGGAHDACERITAWASEQGSSPPNPWEPSGCEKRVQEARNVEATPLKQESKAEWLSFMKI